MVEQLDFFNSIDQKCQDCNDKVCEEKVLSEDKKHVFVRKNPKKCDKK